MRGGCAAHVVSSQRRPGPQSSQVISPPHPSSTETPPHRPEHASAFSGLVRMGMLAAQTALNSEAAKQTPRHKDYAQTRAALAALKTFVNRTDGNTLLLSASFPQKTVNDLVRKEMAPKPVKPNRPAARGGWRGRPPKGE